jgi:hypothetical protein
MDAKPLSWVKDRNIIKMPEKRSERKYIEDIVLDAA